MGRGPGGATRGGLRDRSDRCLRLMGLIHESSPWIDSATDHPPPKSPGRVSPSSASRLVTVVGLTSITLFIFVRSGLTNMPRPELPSQAAKVGKLNQPSHLFTGHGLDLTPNATACRFPLRT